LFYLILNEWLLSLLHVTHTVRVDIFQLFAALIMTNYFWFRQRWIHFVGGWGILLYLIHHLYYFDPLFSLSWLQHLWKEGVANLDFLLQRQWLEVSNECRTILFLLVLWLLIKGFALFKNRSTSFWILIVTAVYLAILDSFLLYDAVWPIIRISVFGLLMVAVERQIQIAEQIKQGRISIRYIAAALVVSLLVTTIGYVTPKAEAKWKDPTGWFSSFTGKGIGSGAGTTIQKIGYGLNDAYLGGPFEQNDTVVMETVSNKRVYWRGESKDQYTGHGWVNSRETHYDDWVWINGKETYDFPVHLIKQDSPLEKQELQYTLFFPKRNFNFFFLGGDWKTIAANDSQEITKAYTNPYDKVTAIKNYLRTHYHYGVEQVPYPKENEDFVDQFLFETKLGYCDHFSSSMVVLTRSIGIPARWVKGFSPGETQFNMESGNYEGVVRNKNAHSWAEVYFDDIGWIPFEATPTFRLPLEYKYDYDMETMEQLDDPDISDFKAQSEVKDPMKEGDIEASAKSSKLFAWIKGITLFLIVCSLILLIRYRTELFFWWTKRRFAKEKSLTGMVIKSTNQFLILLARGKT